MSNKVMELNGRQIDIDVAAELTIQDVSDDMDCIAALMGYWGELWAEAEAAKVNSDAMYRQWKAQTIKAFMAKEPKLAATKLTALVEAEPMFQTLKLGQAEATKNVLIARTHYESFRVKANILQSKGAMYRAERDATSMNTQKTSTKQNKMSNEDKENQVRASIAANKTGE